MADIINIGNEGFASARRSQYVDKSGLIGFVNRTLCSEDKFICVTRARRLSSPSFSSLALPSSVATRDSSSELGSPSLLHRFAPRQSKQASLHSVCRRLSSPSFSSFAPRQSKQASLHSVYRRFGKSMAAKMLCAYYDQSCSSDSLFSDLQIASDPTYPTHLNKYPVIYLDMTFFTTNCKNQDTMVEWMDRWIKSDLQKIYPQVPSAESQPLISYLLALAEHQGKRFIMIIDEWDAICRETSHSSELMRRYVDWLRSMFKSSNTDRVFAGIYMTGILPIKQYDTQSALNNFTHYSVLDPEPLQGYFGFTEEETKALKKRTYSNYWMQTGAYEGLKRYITYNRSTGTVRIPNNEVKKEFEDVIKHIRTTPASSDTTMKTHKNHTCRIEKITKTQGAVKEYYPTNTTSSANT